MMNMIHKVSPKNSVRVGVTGEQAGAHSSAAPIFYSNWTSISVGQFQMLFTLNGNSFFFGTPRKL